MIDGSRPDATPGARRTAWLRRLAWATALGMLVVTSASAWLRLATPRPACADWPACRGAAALAVAPVVHLVPPVNADARHLEPVRALHRFAASAVLLLVCAQLVLALAWRPRERVAGRGAAQLLALALALSVLGVLTPGSKAAAVLLGNLLGGLVMLALAWGAVAAHHDGRVSSPARARLARAVFVLWLVQAALGALSGAGLLRVAPPLHLMLALPALAGAWVVGAGAWREGRYRLGALAMALPLLQFVLGAAAAADGAAAHRVLLHNALAGLGLALLWVLAGDAARAVARKPTTGIP